MKDELHSIFQRLITNEKTFSNLNSLPGPPALGFSDLVFLPNDPSLLATKRCHARGFYQEQKCFLELSKKLS